MDFCHPDFIIIYNISDYISINNNTNTNLSLSLFQVPPKSNKMAATTQKNARILALFDVDGTLTIPRGEITEPMMEFMKELATQITVGIVGGKLEEAVCSC